MYSKAMIIEVSKKNGRKRWRNDRDSELAVPDSERGGGHTLSAQAGQRDGGAQAEDSRGRALMSSSSSASSYVRGSPAHARQGRRTEGDREGVGTSLQGNCELFAVVLAG